MHRNLPFTLILLLPCIWPASAAAQYNRARSSLEKLRSLANDIQPDKEASRIESTAKEMMDAAAAMSSALADVGETLARASGQYESDRSEIYKAAGTMRKLTDKVATNAKNLIEHFQTKWVSVDDYKRALVNKCQDVRMEVANGIGKEWGAFEATIGKTRAWLREQLNAAFTLRDNSAKPLAGLQKVEEQAMARQDAIKQIMKDAFNRWVDADIKLAEANVRENAASQAYEAAKASDADQSKVSSLLSTLAKAGEEKKAAAAVKYEVFDALERASADGKRALSDLSRPMADIRAFVESANSDTINKRWADFDQWTKLLDRDLNR